KQLTRKLLASGVPAVELHGNLGQTARTRNLAAFSSGAAKTLVATDIAARGIHVDDIAPVIHADPPVEHKAYRHRPGLTARAVARGEVLRKAGRVSPGPTRTAVVAHPPVRAAARPMPPDVARVVPGSPLRLGVARPVAVPPSPSHAVRVPRSPSPAATPPVVL